MLVLRVARPAIICCTTGDGHKATDLTLDELSFDENEGSVYSAIGSAIAERQLRAICPGSSPGVNACPIVADSDIAHTDLPT